MFRSVKIVALLKTAPFVTLKGLRRYGRKQNACHELCELELCANILSDYVSRLVYSIENNKVLQVEIWKIATRTWGEKKDSRFTRF